MRTVFVVLLLGPLVACAGADYRTSQPPLPLRSWAPDDRPDAIVIALHGFNDYSRAFEMFGEWASNHRILVDAYDQQGFGETESRGYWSSYSRLSDDLHDRIEARRREYPETPIFVLGESMGAAVALIAQTEPDAPDVDGLILVSPAIWGGDSLNIFYRMVLWTLTQATPGWQLTGRQLKIQASDNIDMLIGLGRDPLVIKATRVDAIAGLVELMDVARERTGDLNIPVLVLSGGKDEVVEPEIQESFMAELVAETCQAVVYENGWHLLLRDHQRELVWRDIRSWIATGRVETPNFGFCGLEARSG